MTTVLVYLKFECPSRRDWTVLQVRTLNRVAMTHPMAVTNCNIDMESLIGDANRSIATLAITTLLKTGAPAERATRMSPCIYIENARGSTMTQRRKGSSPRRCLRQLAVL